MATKKSRKNQRQPKIGHTPSTEKSPRIPSLSKESETILFCFKRFDNTIKIIDEHKYNGDDFWVISNKLKSFEGLTWRHLASNKRRNHPIEVSMIHKDAQDSLRRMQLDDTDHVWSLRFDGESRLWGIPHSRFFLVLWWDPQHKIYEVKKKNT